MKKIHVGFLLSYDYDKLKLSIPPVYAAADRIFIAIDENLTTWSGNKFDVDTAFFDWLEKFDTHKKVEIYRDNFYVPKLTGIQMDTHERHLLSLKMGIGNWLIQVDSDEYFLDFEKYVKELRKYDHYLDNPQKHPIQISGYHIDIYKYLDDGLLYVKDPCKVLLATNYPNYKYGRQTRERIIYVDTFVLHESLSRSEEELAFKLQNWGHREDLEPTFFDKWKSVNKHNYKEVKANFYLIGTQSKELGYIPTKNIDEMPMHFDKIDDLKISKSFLRKKNFGQWFKHLKIFKLNQKPTFEKYF